MKDTGQRDQDRDDPRGSEYCHQETVWKVGTYCLFRDLPTTYVTAAPVLPGILEIREALPVIPANDSGCDAS